jgi:glutaredoxin
MSAEIVVYWRPGCGFCASLERKLIAANIKFRKVNIWDDPQASEFVRSVARGNETVPTLSIGSVSLVNPSLQSVIDTATEHAPGALAN